jgi:pantetheine-phosphate adenylyltransferase
MAKTRPAPARHALFPGTFDPVTLGHLDLIRRASRTFERVTLAVATHPTKTGLLSIDERLDLLRAASSDLPNVDVVRLEGLVVDGCRSLGAGVILRGIRNGADIDYELQMARSNRAMAPDVETVFFGASPEHAHISSTLVRQIAAMGGDLAPFVPKSVVTLLRKRRARPEGS